MDLVRPVTETERSRPCKKGSACKSSLICALASSRVRSYETKREEIVESSCSYLHREGALGVGRARRASCSRWVRSAREAQVCG